MGKLKAIKYAGFTAPGGLTLASAPIFFSFFYCCYCCQGTYSMFLKASSTALRQMSSVKVKLDAASSRSRQTGSPAGSPCNVVGVLPPGSLNCLDSAASRSYLRSLFDTLFGECSTSTTVRLLPDSAISPLPCEIKLNEIKFILKHVSTSTPCIEVVYSDECMVKHVTITFVEKITKHIKHN